MSNKPWDRVDPLDKLIRQTSRCGMTDGVVVTIEFISGFELFNTRPYHNYETWSQGYRVTGKGQRVEREDLDDALKAWAALVDGAPASESRSDEATRGSAGDAREAPK